MTKVKSVFLAAGVQAELSAAVIIRRSLSTMRCALLQVIVFVVAAGLFPAGTTTELVYAQIASTEQPETQNLGGQNEQAPPRGASEELDALVDIFLRMRLAGKLMEQNDWQRTVFVQREIIARLDELLRRNPPTVPPPSSSSAQQEPASEEEQNAQASAKPEQTQTPPTGQEGEGQATEEAAQLEEVRNLLRGFWGQLPERLRASVPETLAEEFLPRYAPLIRQYYRRLAELGGGDQSPNRGP